MIIVTGASRGLGRAIADRLHERGCSVLGLSRTPGDLPFASRPCDVTSYDELKGVARDLKLQKAEVEAVINVAGIASMNLALTTPPSVTQKLIACNLLGTIYSCQLFAPLMVRAARGVIINFSTIAVALGLRGESVYAASKAGVEGFSRAFAREMADFNINVHCIAPGPIKTDLLKGVSDRQIDDIVARQIIPKHYTPQSVCDIVDLLLDARSSSMSGDVIHIGGA